jgi:hypothetical protein
MDKENASIPSSTSSAEVSSSCTKDLALESWYENEHPAEAHEYMKLYAVVPLGTGLWS